jgi:hypothetical protein
LGYSCYSESKLIRHRCFGFGHAGTEEACGNISPINILLHAFSTISLAVHHPMAQRVNALTFLRYT